uniref:Envelope protein m90 n=1 Tax=Mastomys natalensis cytomegalovirus 2 TaxID=2973540 RepID=A0A9Y1IKQ4_9BETA|nr:envelope protein m90 [Mastomys natalensis cytomegalovirus 2]WEG69225.1 envelope protein m90 [Mastomys natalensis cytomegalovirus 2]WEG69364.1 envelope protein m90 [Mastomys natalensis cytomegalovirus 2]WEG69502.1 envelope protein m90 [Mastomys natalensis cytomegalovirus 2]WEG69640.1 envelope protein m90 [Mastomys natalensis cytomegalovirus 2]
MTFILLLLASLSALKYGYGDLYTWIQSSPLNITAKSDLFIINVTVVAAATPRSGVLNDTTFSYVSRSGAKESEAEMPDYDLASREIYETFSPILAMWFRNIKNPRFKTVLFSMFCNASHGSLSMSSPPRRLAFTTFVTAANGPLILHTFSPRQCMEKIETFMMNNINSRIRELLTKTCQLYRHAADGGKTSPNTPVSKPYNLTNMFIIAIMCFCACSIICLYVTFCPQTIRKTFSRRPVSTCGYSTRTEETDNFMLRYL